MQHSYPPPTQRDQADFLLRLYFGSGGAACEQVIRRAYLDLSRTVHGAGAYPEAQGIASRFLHERITALRGDETVVTYSAFDLWHEEICRVLCSMYFKMGYEQFFIGQAQKWVNMALKYVFVFGETRMPGFAYLYPLCHVPIDNILLRTEEFKPLAKFREAWSRIKDYDEYLAFQDRVRQRYPSSAPLAIEFVAWQRSGAA